jgi:hypothetical protein
MIAMTIHTSTTTLYDTDFYAWTMEQATLLRKEKPAHLDWENIAEEIESLGRRERSEIKSRLTVLLEHLLKLNFWKTKLELNQRGWKVTVREQRRQINEQLRESPSLKNYPQEILPSCYQTARERVINLLELDYLNEDLLIPQECPYSLDQTLNEVFLPN